MKMNLHKLIFSLTLFASLLSANAQNLDPTVEVNRAYEGKLMEVHKPAIEMAVPDSVLRFDLDFDYSVFENPYKGAYEFEPYAMELQPVAKEEASRKLYLKAGAGYRLHPVLDIVWAPFNEGPFKMNVHATNRSYIGGYRIMADPRPDEAVAEITRKGRKSTSELNYDVFSSAGVDGRYDRKNFTGFFDLSYYGIQQMDRLRARSYDGLDAGMRFRSKDAERFLTYDIGIDYRLGFDKAGGFDSALQEHVLDVDAVLGMKLHGSHRMKFDFGADVNSYSGMFRAGAERLSIAPHYEFSAGAWDFSLGVKVTAIVRTAASDSLMYRTSPGQIFYPDVKVSYEIIPDMMKAYAVVGGGAELNSYASLLSANHHFDAGYGRSHWGLLDSTVERVSASAGLKGRVGMWLDYDFRAGYALYANDVFESIVVSGSREGGELKYLPGTGYAPCQKVFAALDWNWNMESLRFDGSVLCSPWIKLEAPGLFAPALLTGDVAFTYNWKRRLYLGADCVFSTARKGGVLYEDGSVQDAKVPGYADLGLYFEYMTNRKLSVWLRGGNLLDMTIQRNLLYAEDGVYFTAGVCFKL